MMSALAQPRHSGFDDVVGDATIEMLASGFGFLEGPVWHPYEKWLVFSDIPESRIYRRHAEGGIELLREPATTAPAITPIAIWVSSVTQTSGQCGCSGCSV